MEISHLFKFNSVFCGMLEQIWKNEGWFVNGQQVQAGCSPRFLENVDSWSEEDDRRESSMGRVLVER